MSIHSAARTCPVSRALAHAGCTACSLALPAPPYWSTWAGLHPEGEAYAPGLFTFDGDRLVAGLARRARGGFEWVVRDLVSGAAGAFALEVAGYRNLLLYGSETRDEAGRFYVGGWTADGRGGQRPLRLQLAMD